MIIHFDVSRQKSIIAVEQAMMQEQKLFLVAQKDMSVEEVKNWVIDQFKVDDVFKMDYYDIVDGNTLQSVSSWEESDYIVGCIAIYCGKIRLIDNIHY